MTPTSELDYFGARVEVGEVSKRDLHGIQMHSTEKSLINFQAEDWNFKRINLPHQVTTVSHTIVVVDLFA